MLPVILFIASLILIGGFVLWAINSKKLAEWIEEAPQAHQAKLERKAQKARK